MYNVIITKDALKDLQKLTSAGLDKKAKSLIELLKDNPFTNPQAYEKLVGDLSGMQLRRINIKHRLVYSVNENSKTVKIVSLWSHYDD